MARPQRTTISGLLLLLLLCAMVVLAAGEPAGRYAQPQPQQHAPPSGTEQRHNMTEAGGTANTTHAAGPGGNATTTAVPSENATTTVNATARRLLRDGKPKGA